MTGANPNHSFKRCEQVGMGYSWEPRELKFMVEFSVIIGNNLDFTMVV